MRLSFHSPDLSGQQHVQKALISKFYGGSIPTLTFLDTAGKVVYNEAGETSGRRGDAARLTQILDSAKKASR